MKSKTTKSKTTTSFLVQDGTTSVALDTELLTDAAGLTLTSADNTVEPISEEFDVGFDITEESDFIFSDEDGFTPISGEIKHTGTVTFTTSEADEIIVGDFDIGYDDSRMTEDASGFYVENTVDGDLDDTILFDLGNPESLEITESELKIGDADLLVASEFAEILLDTGLAEDDLTGADVGDAAIHAITTPANDAMFY